MLMRRNRRAAARAQQRASTVKAAQATEGDLPKFLASRWGPDSARVIDARQRTYLAFCTEHKLDPAEANSLATAIMEWCRVGRALNTIKSNVYAAAHLYPGLSRHKTVRDAIEAARRQPGAAADKKLPFSWTEMRALQQEVYAVADKDDGDVSQVRGLHDWTFFLVAYLGMFRGAELARKLCWADVTFEATGVVLTVRCSKTDVEGKGAKVCLHRHDDASLCPAQQLTALRDVQDSSLATDFVFRDLADEDTWTAPSTNAMRSRLRKYLANVPLAGNVEDYGLHSFRRGGATAAAVSGIPVRVIKNHGRWKSGAVHRYMEVADHEAWDVTARIMK